MPPVASSLVSRADALVQRNDIAGAYEVLRAAQNEDAAAALMLGDWRLSGAIIRRDLALACDAYGKAAALGNTTGLQSYLALLASGPGSAQRDWTGAVEQLAAAAVRDSDAAKQTKLIRAMKIDPDGDPLTKPVGQVLFADPLLVSVPSFLTRKECAYFIATARTGLHRATVVHPQTGQMIDDPVRNARVAIFPLVAENPFIHAINRRIAAATHTDWAQGEPAQVLWYERGEEFKLHVDALPPGQNQRMGTFLVALSEDFRGGETSFPRIDFDWRGKTGDALFFRNVDEAGRPDPRLIHCGQPIRSGRKALLSRWLRASPIDLSGPPGRPF